ncbi:MAG: hypothetical protein GX829_12425 [Clostridium sp.]|nr:hypothetical protein [Clostridium sp.]
MERQYDNIFKRHSTRMYNMEPLDEKSLDRVREIIEDPPNLFEGLKVSFTLIEDGQEFSEKSSGIIGAYSKVKAPHFLVLTVEEKPGYRQASGYSLAHVVLLLNDLGIGTCITYPNMDNSVILKYMDIKEGDVPLLFIAFGTPLNPIELYQKIDPSKRRLLKDLIVQGPVKRKYKYILEAARLAPSSFNTQPWRFAVDNNKIHILRIKLGFIKNKLFSSSNKIDMGIALAFMIISLKAKGMKFKLLKENLPYENLEYMITIEINDI